MRELGGSALYGARFRENAARALLIPRRRPGQRTPLWQQRLKAQSLLQVAEGYGSFPIVLETYRECLQDVFDLPALRDLLSGLERREIALVEAETPYGSPFASSLLFDYIAQYMYEGDTPPAERRAQALSLDRELLRELLGSDELRELLDPDALAEVEALIVRRPGPGPDGLHDWLRRVGDLAAAEIDDDAGSTELVRQRRAARLRIAGEERLIAVEDAGRYRDAVGALPPPGLPDAHLEPVAHALRGLIARYARTHGPFHPEQPAARFGVPLQRVLDELRVLEVDGTVVRGAMRPGGQGEEWCDADVLRRIRRAIAGPPAGRGRGRARARPWRASSRAGRASTTAPAAGTDRLRDGSSSCRACRWPPRSSSPPCCRAASRATARSCWTGSARPARSSGAARATAGSPCTSATTRRCSARPPARYAPDGELAALLRERVAQAARSSATSCGRAEEPRPMSRRRCGCSSGPAR